MQVVIRGHDRRQPVNVHFGVTAHVATTPLGPDRQAHRNPDRGRLRNVEVGVEIVEGDVAEYPFLSTSS